MATVTLVDVIASMRNEGDLNRNSGTNSIKSVKALISEDTTVLRDFTSSFMVFADNLSKSLTTLVDRIAVPDTLQSREDALEQNTYQAAILSLLTSIDSHLSPDRTTNSDWTPYDYNAPRDSLTGFLGTGVAAGAGALAGGASALGADRDGSKLTKLKEKLKGGFGKFKKFLKVGGWVGVFIAAADAIGDLQTDPEFMESVKKIKENWNTKLYPALKSLSTELGEGFKEWVAPPIDSTLTAVSNAIYGAIKTSAKAAAEATDGNFTKAAETLFTGSMKIISDAVLTMLNTYEPRERSWKKLNDDLDEWVEKTFGSFWTMTFSDMGDRLDLSWKKLQLKFEQTRLENAQNVTQLGGAAGGGTAGNDIPAQEQKVKTLKAEIGQLGAKIDSEQVGNRPIFDDLGDLAKDYKKYYEETSTEVADREEDLNQFKNDKTLRAIMGDDDWFKALDKRQDDVTVAKAKLQGLVNLGTLADGTREALKSSGMDPEKIDATPLSESWMSMTEKRLKQQGFERESGTRFNYQNLGRAISETSVSGGDVTNNSTTVIVSQGRDDGDAGVRASSQ